MKCRIECDYDNLSLMDKDRVLKESLMTIGRFSKSCRLTIKALRYYDEVDILKPAYVDPDSGYRYYEQHQARTAVLIGMLRSLDIPVPIIKNLLNANGTDFQSILNQEHERALQKLHKQQQILNSIKRIASEGELTPYQIQIREEPSHIVSRLSVTSSLDNLLEDGEAVIYKLYGILQDHQRDYIDPVMCINDDPDENDIVTIHACIGIEPPYPDLSPAEVVDIPGGPVAWLTHKGSYNELGIAYHSLFAWIQEHGYKQRNAMREVYMNDPAQTKEDDLITEVILPII